MFIETNSLQVTVNNTTINLGDYITEARYQYPKLWGKDSGRNLKGVMTGTLIGIFPKITVSFRKLTKNELKTLAPILDSATQTVRYYDPRKRAYTTMDTYTGDWEISNKKIIDDSAKMGTFSISFISRRKR